MEFNEFKKRNPQLTIYLMNHIDRIRCDNLGHYYNNNAVIVLRHKRLCKDGKYREIINGVEYCGVNLIEKNNQGCMVSFSSSELKDLEEVIEVKLNV